MPSPLVALDSSAVLRWLIQEQGWKGIQQFVARGADLILPGPALAEVIRIARVRGNVSSPEELCSALYAAGMRVELSSEADLVRAGGLAILSAEHPELRSGSAHTLSMGDCLILATAQRLDAPILTCDRHWGWLRDQGKLNNIHVI